MRQFENVLTQTIGLMMQLCQEFDRLESEYFEILCNEYPFSQDLNEVVLRLLEWRESVRAEIEKRGGTTDAQDTATV